MCPWADPPRLHAFAPMSFSPHQDGHCDWNRHDCCSCEHASSTRRRVCGQLLYQFKLSEGFFGAIGRRFRKEMTQGRSRFNLTVLPRFASAPWATKITRRAAANLFRQRTGRPKGHRYIAANRGRRRGGPRRREAADRLRHRATLLRRAGFPAG
jgi:hypothetical protein